MKNAPGEASSQLQQTVTKEKQKSNVAQNLNFYVKSCDFQTNNSTNLKNTFKYNLGQQNMYVIHHFETSASNNNLTKFWWGKNTPNHANKQLVIFTFPSKYWFAIHLILENLNQSLLLRQLTKLVS